MAESWRRQFSFTGDWSLMGHIDGAGGEFFAWERWYLGWIAERQVACSAYSSIEQHEHGMEFVLSPVEEASISKNSKKLIVIKLSERQAICVEFRRAIGYDSRIRKEGLLVYLVEMSAASGESGAIRVLPLSDTDFEKWNVTLGAGESLYYKGVGLKHVCTLRRKNSSVAGFLAKVSIKRGGFKSGHRHASS